MKRVFLATVTKTGLSFSEGNKVRLYSMAEELEGKKVRVTVETTQRPKTEESLGFYWGGLLPAYVAHKKDLITQESLNTNPFQLKELAKAKAIKSKEVSDVHGTFMTEYAPMYVRDLSGTITKQRGEMKKMNNTELIEYCTVVLDYFISNGIPVPNSGEYKYFRDVILNGIN